MPVLQSVFNYTVAVCQNVGAFTVSTCSGIGACAVDICQNTGDYTWRVGVSMVEGLSNVCSTIAGL